MKLDQFISKVNSSLAYLFDEYGFSIRYTKHIRSYNNWVGLENEKCRIFIEQDRGGGMIGIANRSVEFPHSSKWVGVPSLIAYLLEKQHFFFTPQEFAQIQGALERLAPEFLKIESEIGEIGFLKDLALRMRPFLPKFMELFGDDTIYPNWILDFREWSREKLHKQYPQLKRKGDER